MAQLEQWARDQKIEDTGSKVIDTLLPIIQVSAINSNLKQSFVLIQFHIISDFSGNSAATGSQIRRGCHRDLRHVIKSLSIHLQEHVFLAHVIIYDFAGAIN